MGWGGSFLSFIQTMQLKYIICCYFTYDTHHMENKLHLLLLLLFDLLMGFSRLCLDKMWNKLGLSCAIFRLITT